MDWNWFFASIAQAVGALVGVVIAFLVATVSGAKSRFEEHKATTRSLVDDAEKLRGAFALRRWDWLQMVTLQHLVLAVRQKFQDEHGNALELLTPEEYLATTGHRTLASREGLTSVVKAAIETERKRREDEEGTQAEKEAPKQSAVPKAYSQFDTVAAFTSEGSRRADHRALEYELGRREQERRDMNAEFDAIDQLVVEARHHMRLIQAHVRLLEQNPERSSLDARVVLGSAILFTVGVLWPLSLTPVSTDARVVDPVTYVLSLSTLGWLKQAMLIVAGVLFYALLLMLWRQNSQLTHDPSAISQLRGWLELEAYSHHLRADRYERQLYRFPPGIQWPRTPRRVADLKIQEHTSR